ncbi:hypothetical protein MX569_11465 [Anoxybacillus kestanbolensis]|uniref:hypothetical protein n=1 Tax=Anoxybacillus TaxID=150247 RepID=UPI001EDBAC59|nr:MULTISPECIES: hypothetical protein [Anoxybacillus]MCG3084444.1 hypothetical protein [Anoxybacillus sp. LAT27]MCG5026446.1 hypothetical protein [Anoxybacillus flavithermus]MCL9971206.1 hypothetical protein [Anoxybacillus kestanbolensis]MCX8047374.1 hypothetical protein [Anoxybacillus gonensis]
MRISANDFELLKRWVYSRKNSILFETEHPIMIIEEGDKVILKPERKRLTKEEKLALAEKLAGSADCFSVKGVEESIRIANREYDREDEACAES